MIFDSKDQEHMNVLTDAFKKHDIFSKNQAATNFRVSVLSFLESNPTRLDEVERTVGKLISWSLQDEWEKKADEDLERIDCRY